MLSFSSLFIHLYENEFLKNNIKFDTYCYL